MFKRYKTIDTLILCLVFGRCSVHKHNNVSLISCLSKDGQSFLSFGGDFPLKTVSFSLENLFLDYSGVLKNRHSCGLMDPGHFWPFFDTTCDLVDPKISCGLMDRYEIFPH